MSSHNFVELKIDKKSTNFTGVHRKHFQIYDQKNASLIKVLEKCLLEHGYPDNISLHYTCTECWVVYTASCQTTSQNMSSVLWFNNGIKQLWDSRWNVVIVLVHSIDPFHLTSSSEKSWMCHTGGQFHCAFSYITPCIEYAVRYAVKCAF